MYDISLVVHNLLRWIILLLLLVNIVHHISVNKPFTKADESWGRWLLIASHIMLLLGLYQWIAGALGLNAIQDRGMGDLMKDKAGRYWAVEHLVGMIAAIVLITVGFASRKRAATNEKKHRMAFVFYLLALIIILAMMPWPGREQVGRALFRGL